MTSRISLFSILAFAVIFNGCAAKPKVTITEGSTGKLEVVSGEVLVKSAQTGETKVAKTDQKIIATDTIITGKNARTKIVMADKNEIHLSPDSKVEIKEYGADHKGKVNVLIKLLNGKVRANVRQKYDGKDKVFQIQTRTAVAGVRGTEFAANFDDTTSRAQIVTFDGSVEFGLPGPGNTIVQSVKVGAGESSVAVGGFPPALPLTLSKEQLAEFDKESNVEVPNDLHDPSESAIKAPETAIATTTDATSSNTEADVALRWLRNGNIRFVKNRLRHDGQSKNDIARLAKGQHPHSIILTCSDSRIPPEIIFDQKLGEIFVIRTADKALDKSVITSIESAFSNLHPRLLLILGNPTCLNAQAVSKKLQTDSAVMTQAIQKNEIKIQTAVYDLNTGIVQFD